MPPAALSNELTMLHDVIRGAYCSSRCVENLRAGANFRPAFWQCGFIWSTLLGCVTLCSAKAAENSIAQESQEAVAVLSTPAISTKGIEVSAAAVTTSPAAACGADLEYWLVSTRRLGCWRGQFAAEAGPGFSVSRYISGECRWQSADTAELVAAAQVVRPTWVLIHGNRYNSQDAIDFGWLAAHTLAAGRAADQPVRVIIWSWPSDQIHGAIKDAQAKAARTGSEGIYLSWLVDHLPHETPLCIVGSSLGARIGTGAMHLLSAGSLAGYSLPQPDFARTPLRGIFMASALHDNWLLPNSVHGRALNNVDQVLFLNNNCDPVLKRYRFIEDCGNPAAAGYSGARLTANQMTRVRQWNASNSVGKTHDYEAYFRAGNLAAQMRAVAAFAEPVAAK